MPVKYQYGKFPPEKELDWFKLIPVLGPTAAAVARFDEMLGTIPNPSFFLDPLTTNEAVLSSRIEGTRATMREVLEFEAEEPQSSSIRGDISEILNYREAIAHATNMLKTQPLGGRIIQEAHRILLSGSRGQNLSPGQYRKVQNWIGCSNDIEQATYVPVRVDRLQESMAAWEQHIHADSHDGFVQISILHAEFEAIHPFMDGNGRLGRMLVPLLLSEKKLIREPYFYVSAFLEKNRNDYYEGLLAVSRDNDWTGWCCFFLEAIRIQADDNLKKVRNMFELQNKLNKKVSELPRSHFAILAVEWIFSKPIFSSTDFFNNAKIPVSSARRILQLLTQNGILRESFPGKGRRAAVFEFQELLKIIDAQG